ncbi:MAG: YdiU family protein [Gammaproteobacteria bacterium]|nr:MAG: YdiU family protein [Gammaproteobacteria bacterium]
MTTSTLQFDNSFARLGDDFFSHVTPSPLPSPWLVSINPAAAELIGLDAQALTEDWFLQWCSGNLQLPGSEPLAMVYSGHQFGSYVPQLGDGRGLLLGEVVGPEGKWDIHLKGAGQTPYSRFGDGRAVLRSTIREYLCSEAMHGLGIATTRALSITASDEPVMRERVEQAAMLIRLARSHVRFGSFEYFHHQRRPEQVQVLADHVIQQHLPELTDREDRYVEMFRHAVHSTARLIAHWQVVGFAHGVMNTDNMSIIGDTLDYGPFGFLDNYDPDFICNHSDVGGRYAFKRQPVIGLWNLNALANALTSLIEVEDLKTVLEEYEQLFLDTQLQLQRQKLGLADAEEQDQVLIDDLLAYLARNNVDYTIFFRSLCDFQESGPNDRLRDLFLNRSDFDSWAPRYRQRLSRETCNADERRSAMRRTNPKYVLRNYMAEIAIRKAQDDRDYSEIDRLLNVLQRPFDEHPDCEEYARHPPAWSQDLSVSCSS